MRKTKKLSALTIAACMSVGLAVPLNVGGVTADAAAWKCGDVDNDGQLTMMDQVSLNKYLAGKIELVDYTKADTNADCLVDIVDSKILRMRLAEQISALPYTRYGGGSQYASVGAKSVNESRGYTTFDAKTGEGKNGYFLDPNPIEDNTRAIIGEDTRYRDDSLPGVVKIITERSSATGFVVDAHTIATAAHCVYDGLEPFKSDTKLKQILILNKSGDVEKKIDNNIYETHVPNKYITNINDCNSVHGVIGDEKSKIADAYDYALITVKDDLSKYACFDLGIVTDGIMSDSQKLYCTGFPAIIIDGDSSGEVNTSTKHKRFTGEGFMMPDVNQPFPERKIYYDIDTYGGNSGGPVYVENTIGDTTYYTVIGIHTRRVTEKREGEYYANAGVQMTTELLHFYKNNEYIEWGE